MKPKIFQYRFGGAGTNFLAIINQSEEDQIEVGFMKPWTKSRARDLALYTHWPVHTKEFWDLLNEP
jgi:hypothetical protein